MLGAFSDYDPVPFDGSALSVTALSRAAAFADAFDESVLALSVIPQDNTPYARERGWIGAGESFDIDAVVASLREQVAGHAPEAEFRFERVGRDVHAGSIAREIRKIARQVDARMVFVGSDNAGRLVTTLSSVGGNVAADPTYDVVIVRHAREFPDPVEAGVEAE